MAHWLLFNGTPKGELATKNILSDWDSDKPPFEPERKDPLVFVSGQTTVPPDIVKDTMSTLKTIMAVALINIGEDPTDYTGELEFIANAKKRVADAGGKNLNLEVLELNNLLTVGETNLLTRQKSQMHETKIIYHFRRSL